MSDRQTFTEACATIPADSKKRKPAVTVQITAPYNFVPLVGPLPSAFGDRAPSHIRPEPDGACGRLTVEWVFERPVLIGGSAADKDGFSVFATDSANRPVLPGSTTRGLARSLIEIAAGGRLEFYDRDAHFAVRNSDDDRLWKPLSPIGKGRALSFGWLRRRNKNDMARDRDYEGWVIEIVNKAWQLDTASLKLDVPAFEGKNVGDKVAHLLGAGLLRVRARVKGKPNAAPYVEQSAAHDDPQGDTQGWVVVTGVDPAREGNANSTPAPKRYATLFVDQPRGATFDVPPEVMRRFIKTHNTTPGESVGAWDYWREELNDGMPTVGGQEMPGIPVFIGHAVRETRDPRNSHEQRNKELAALLTRLQGDAGRRLAAEDASLLYLSLSRFVKIPHRRSLRQIVEAQGHVIDAPLDFARAMFGQVPPEKLAPEIEEKPGRGALKGRVFFGEAALRGAGQPQSDDKIGVTMAPRASFWPYYLKPGDPSEPYDYSNPTSEVAGWKRYPVRAQAVPFLRDDRPTAPAPNAHGVRDTESGMRFLRATKERPLVFRGEIRFHNLKPAEIGALIWALTWGDGVDGARKPQRHLVGRGKAQGYGLCFARIVDTRIEMNLGDDAPEASIYVDAFRTHVLEAWNASQPAKVSAFERLPMVEALLAMGDPAIAAGLEQRLIYPSVPARPWAGGAYGAVRAAAGANPDSSPSLDGYKAVRDAASRAGRDTSLLPPYPRRR